MSQYMHLFVSFLLCDLTNMFFLEKYFLSESQYEEAQEQLPFRLIGHFIFYGIVFYMIGK